MLLNITISEFDWAILSFAIAELIVFIKFIVSLHTKSKLMENELMGLKEQFKMQTDQFEELKSSMESHFQKTIDYFEKSNSSRDSLKDELIRELRTMEDKFDIPVKELHGRINELAQGLVAAETELKILKS